MTRGLKKALLGLGAIALAAGLGGCQEDPPKVKQQTGYRGTGMVQIYDTDRLDLLKADNQVPEAYPREPDEGPRASEIYENVQVLGNLSEANFLRLMTAMTEWVSPDAGCNYCHNPENLAADDVYTKVVSRRMLQMTQHINATWEEHVGGAGVTCYTCHRGQPVPQYIWFKNEGPPQALGMAGYRGGQNVAERSIGTTSLPYDPFTPLLEGGEQIRMTGLTALPTGNDASIQLTERTYSLMIHMSSSLGVNCTYCHNSRAFGQWDESHVARVPAWYGIRMVRDLNTNFLAPLQPTYPPNRLGAHGDAPKANCTTCHQGVAKPLYGVNMVSDYPELGTVSTQ